MTPAEVTDQEDAREFLASFRVARINLSVPAAITFRSEEAGELSVSWHLWLEEWFRPILAPSFLDVYAAARKPDFDAVLAVDARLDRELPPESQTASREAGNELFLALEGARHLGVPARFRAAALESRTSGHFTAALAARCSAFHVPPVAALFGYCYLEWFGGRLAVHGPARQPVFLRESGLALSYCREATLAARADELHLASVDPS